MSMTPEAKCAESVVSKHEKKALYRFAKFLFSCRKAKSACLFFAFGNVFCVQFFISVQKVFV